MNDKSDIDDAEGEATEEAQGPIAGARLAAARREQQISVDDVAKELHLDEPKVRALEQNEFETLGAPVFAKGHLRKYAMLVGISVEEAIAEYESLNEASDELPVVGLTRRAPREVAPGPWVALIVTAMVLASAYWWFVVRIPADSDIILGPAAPVESADTTPEPMAIDVSADDEAPPEESDVDAPEVGETVEPEANEPVAAEADPPVAAAATDDQSTLTVRFSGDCWTEITDARGERLFFALGREGRTVNLVGEAPFSVVFGDADNVSLAIDNQPYSIPASDRNGRMARLTIVAR